MQKYNTGTYNNQYMVVDFNLYQPGKALAPGTLWVIDQVPGLVAAADMTETLTRGYWPSYNVPYFQEVCTRPLSLSVCLSANSSHTKKI